MTRYPPFPIVIAGAASALSCILFASNPFFVYLPALPLFIIGLWLGPLPLLLSAAIAGVPVLLIDKIDGALWFAFLIAAPSWFFTRKALSWKGDAGAPVWYPVLRILSELTLSAALLFTALTIAVSHTTPGGLPAAISAGLKEVVKSSNPDMAGMLHMLVDDWLFAIFAATGWIWMLSLYALALLANATLKRGHHALRPSLALTPRGIPLPLLPLLALCVILLVLSGPADRFLLLTDLLLLLFPYFMAGMALLHEKSLGWKGRQLWLALIYISFIFFVFPLFFAAGAGIMFQAAEMLDSRRKMG